jgi:hypothetical protein
MEADSEDEFISNITPNVMGCLVNAHFFEKLDDILSPREETSSRQVCGGDYKLSESLLIASEFSREDLTDVWAVLQSQGGFCDCEILYNVSRSSRLATKYWRKRAAELEAGKPTKPPSHLDEKSD